MRAALKRAQQLTARHEQALREARLEGYAEGQQEGIVIGRNQTLRNMLFAAGDLFGQERDVEARAVREVHHGILGIGQINEAKPQ